MERARTGLLSGSGLKRIAIASMLLDHIGYVLVWEAYLSAGGAAQAGMWYGLYTLLRMAGRLAFPIFCFQLTEGFFHTHSRGRYALRLGLFALASEVPFDLAFRGALWDGSYQNVFFTLLLGLLALWGWEALARRLPRWARWPAALPPLLLCAAAAEWLATDYGAFGVTLILVLGVSRDAERSTGGQELRLPSALSGALVILIYCFLENNWIEIVAALGLELTLLYNGQRGRGSRWGFYLFYPAHLLVLVGLRALMF